MDGAQARAELWRRYDAGDVSAAEVETRLQLLDRAGDDEAAVRRALDGRLSLAHRARGRRTVVLAALALLLVGGTGVVAVAKGDNGASPTATSVFNGGGAGPVIVDRGVAVDVAVEPFPPPPPPECLPEEEAPADPEGELPANPSLLSDPAFVPEGYEIDDDDDMAPGFDPDLAMSTASGNPAPVEIRARELAGDLVVRIRGWRYDDAATASEAGRSTLAIACQYTVDSNRDEANPQILVSLVSGPIPDTAFAGFQVGERRVLVSVETAGDEDAARALAAEIARAEYDAATNPPAEPAP
jgi:hypothetical protein